MTSIRLIGGPAHNKVVDWHGGEYFQWAEGPQPDDPFSMAPQPVPMDAVSRVHEYKRRESDPRYFDYLEPSTPLLVRGVGRDVAHDRMLAVYFNRKPTDDELRRFHDLIREGQA